MESLENDFSLNNIISNSYSLREKIPNKIYTNKLPEFIQQLENINKMNLNWDLKQKIKSYVTRPIHPLARLVKSFFKRRQKYDIYIENSMLHPELPIRKFALGKKYSGEYITMPSIIDNIWIYYRSDNTKYYYDIYNIVSCFGGIIGQKEDRENFDSILKHLKNVYENGGETLF
jgi:hypothetical protein